MATGSASGPWLPPPPSTVGRSSSEVQRLSKQSARPPRLSGHEFTASAWLRTPSNPKTPHAQPASIAVDPHTMSPLAMPMVCT